jgi:helix-turn-helix resolvase-like protein
MTACTVPSQLTVTGAFGQECPPLSAEGRRHKVPAAKLSAAQQAHVVKLHAGGEHSIAELAELFSVSRPTVYRVLERAPNLIMA